jgi:hypothetical protein
LSEPTDDAAAIVRHSIDLLAKTQAGRVPVRLIGVSVSQLLHADDPEQLRLDV